MKKKIVLLPLLALMLTACDLSNLMPNGGNNNNEPAESRERSSLSPNDVAIKIADYVSVFPEVGDELDMSDYISFDTGTSYKLEQFTFESQNPDVISINNYHARCLKDGYASIKVTGPNLERAVEISFYVGSIAGHYIPESSRLAGVIDFSIAGNFTDGYTFSLNVDNSKVSEYNRKSFSSYEGNGTLIKNLSPFLPMEFSGAAPSSFEPVTDFLSLLVGEEHINEFKDLTGDIYGFMVADPVDGVILKMRFNESFINLILE